MRTSHLGIGNADAFMLRNALGITGVSSFLAHQIQALTEGWPTLLFIGIIVIFLTEISSNTDSTALLVAIFATVAIDMGISTTEIILPLAVAASCVFMLPVATPPHAIVFNSGYIQQRDMLRIGFALNLTFAVLLTLLSQILFYAKLAVRLRSFNAHKYRRILYTHSLDNRSYSNKMSRAQASHQESF
jgi:di/tricarboxylate transporter